MVTQQVGGQSKHRFAADLADRDAMGAGSLFCFGLAFAESSIESVVGSEFLVEVVA